MADQPAANPAMGAEGAKAAPPAPPTTKDAATDYFRSILNPEPQGQPAEAPETEQTNRAKAEPKANPEEAKGESEAESHPEAEKAESPPDTDTEDTDEEPAELPDTLDGMAKALGMSKDEFAKHLTVEIETPTGTERVNLSDLSLGYLREADYRRKTQEVAAERRQIGEEKQNFQTQWQTKLADLESNVKAFEGLLGSPPDPALMLNPASPHYNPDAFHLQTAQYQQVKSLLDSAKAKLGEEASRHKEEQAKRLTEYRKSQWDSLLKRVPEFKDQAKLRSFETEAVKRLSDNYGFTKEEVHQFFQNFDARHVPMIRDAFAYRALEEGKKKTLQVVKSAPQKLAAGSSEKKADPEQKKQRDVLRRLRNSRRGSRDFKQAAIDRFSPLLKG